MAAQRLGVEVARRAQHRDEEFGLEVEREGGFVVDGDGETRKVDEELLCGLVVEAHDDVATAPPVAVALAELGVAVTVGVQFAVFEPEQLQGHALLGELLLHGVVVGLGVTRRRVRDIGKESSLEGVVVHLLGQRPTEARHLRAIDVIADRRARHGQRRRGVANA